MAYKVSYFDITALGEPLRFLCSYGNLDWEDFRVGYTPGVPSQQWLELKPKMPYGQMPILEHEGKVAHQSVAISRFLAKKVKLVGKDDWEDLIIDSTVDTVNDFRAKIGKYHYETDAAVKETIKGPLFTEQIPYYLKKLDEAAKTNGGFLAINRLTWADLFFVSLWDYLNGMAQIDLFSDYPNLQKVKENVFAVQNIKTWIEKRPKTII